MDIGDPIWMFSNDGNWIDPATDRMTDVPAQLDQRRGRAAQQLVKVGARLDPRPGMKMEGPLQTMLASDLRRLANAFCEQIPLSLAQVSCSETGAAARKR